MKTLKTILCAVALTMAFLTSKADFVMTANANAEIQKTFSFTSNAATTATASINSKYIYTLVSNAVASVTNWAGTNIAATNLPADGYIAYSPYANDTSVMGVFYVTNKSGFYYQLSGLDTNGEYYSWIELDSLDFRYVFVAIRPGTIFVSNIFVGWVKNGNGPFGGIASYHVNSKTNGIETTTSTAVFYVHDDPYNYDDAHNPSILFGNNLDQGNGDDLLGVNNNAVEVRGILTATINVTNADGFISNLSLTGPGNLIYAPNPSYPFGLDNVIKTGTVRFTK